MVTLIILDGFGISKQKFGNAILQAGTPNLDKLKKRYSSIQIEASGKFAGLPDGQMGNSEAGHLTLGAGRPIFQDFSLINKHIEEKTFFDNQKLNLAMQYLTETGGNLHLIGLVSDGGVHSHISHLSAIIEIAEKYPLKNIFLHAFLDGRDTAVDSGLEFIKEIQTKHKNVEIATVSGRLYGMDREKNFDRTEAAYDAIVLGKAEEYYQTATQGIEENYRNKITDEFIKPFVIGKAKTINNGDAVIFFNFRKDRARQLVEAITQPNFTKFKTKHLENVFALTLTEYDPEFTGINVAFPPEKITNTLAETLSKHGKTQFHIAETTKYAHVTYYFNGGREQPFPGEDRKLINTIKDENFANHPKMRAMEITENTLEAIQSQKYDFILVNFSNPDMVGHTGNLDATKEAITCVDKCAYLIAMATLMADGECIITADHGNAERVLNPDKTPNTAHTTNPVPLIIASEKRKIKLAPTGGIGNIAPTILTLLNLPIPAEMHPPLIIK